VYDLDDCTVRCLQLENDFLIKSVQRSIESDKHRNGGMMATATIAQLNMQDRAPYVGAPSIGSADADKSAFKDETEKGGNKK